MSPKPQVAARTVSLAQSVRESLERRRKLWVWVERILFTCGLTLLAVYGASRFDRYVQAKSALDDFTALSAAYSATDHQQEAADGVPKIDFSLWDGERVQAYKESLIRQFNAPLAVLEIPKVHLQAPVLDGTDAVKLNRGVGWIAGTARPGEQGNIGIAGHRDGFFRGLKDVRMGDAIELKTLDRNDTYIVD